MDFQSYLKKDIKCSCGHIHRCDIEDIIIAPGAVEELPRLLNKGDYHHICIVEDENTKQVLGERVAEIVLKAGYKLSEVVLLAEHLLPDETGIGSVLTGVPEDSDLILAVGTGTLNDLGKFVSSKMKIPYFIIGTASSMDGFASNVAAMVTKQAKATYNAQMPAAIIGDVDVMAEAPLDLIAAGVGDVLGKYVCLTDWKLSSILTGEYYCEYVAELVKEAVEKVRHAAETLAVKRDVQCITELMEGLVLSGIAMSYIGNSRPASGSEHHLSHFWEMHFLQFGEHGAYHGTKVGVGTTLCLKMYEWLSQENLDESILTNYTYEQEKWEQEIWRVYQKAAPAVIDLENKVHKNVVEKRDVRMKNLLSHQQEIRAIIDELPKAEDFCVLMENLKAPVFPSQIEVTEDRVVDGCRYAKELRDRTGLLQILHDLGLAETYGQRVLKEFCK